MQQVTDECSRIDFGMMFKTAQKSKLDTSRYPVQESWEKLCSGHTDLKPYLDAEPVEAPQVLDITHQITNLISEADLTHSRCLNFVSITFTLQFPLFPVIFHSFQVSRFLTYGIHLFRELWSRWLTLLEILIRLVYLTHLHR